MAADGLPGPKGNPQFLGTGAPATAVDLNLISLWAASVAGPSVATVAALPNTGNWPGRIIHVANINSLYLFNTTWSLFTGSRRGFFAGSTDINGDIGIFHGLGATPVSVQITGGVGGVIPALRTYAIREVTTGQFVVRVYRQGDGSALSSNPVDFYWTATL